MASANRVPTKILNIFQYYYIIMLLVLNAAESEESREKNAPRIECIAIALVAFSRSIHFVESVQKNYLWTRKTNYIATVTIRFTVGNANAIHYARNFQIKSFLQNSAKPIN